MWGGETGLTKQDWQEVEEEIQNPAMLDPPKSRPSGRPLLDSGYKDVDHDLPWSADQRNWAALPRDVLWLILSRVPQADILRGAGLVCASWRRLAHDEPLLWRRIDLAADEDEDEDAPAGWQAVARAAVRRSAGLCESFRGRVNGEFLLFLARSAPSLRSVDVTSRFETSSVKLITAVAKKLPLLERLVLSDGMTSMVPLAPLVEHCPRLQLPDASGRRTSRPMSRTQRAWLESRIKGRGLQLCCGGVRLGGHTSVRSR